jgi:mannose-6-phosphate isomerase-like protein (cupin superfamily)
MRAMLSVLALLVAVSTGDQPPTSATYVTSEDVQAAVKIKELNIRIVDAGGYNIAVGAIRRENAPPGQPAVHFHAAVHFKVSEVYHVFDGAATLVTGGTIVNMKMRPPDAKNVRLEDGPGAEGPAIQGGESRRIKAGDVVIIPAGVPHQFTEVEGSITYIVVRVDPSRVLPPN